MEQSGLPSRRQGCYSTKLIRVIRKIRGWYLGAGGKPAAFSALLARIFRQLEPRIRPITRIDRKSLILDHLVLPKQETDCLSWYLPKLDVSTY